VSVAIEALRKAYNEQKEANENLAERVCELEVDLYHFRNMSVIDFMLFAFTR